MHDNGNFVMYSYSSGAIWESFSHPTDTILGGQELRSGQTLKASSSGVDHQGYRRTYWLGIDQEYYGNLVIRDSAPDDDRERVIADPLTLNLDPIDGRLYLVDGNDKVLQNITRGDYRRNALDCNVIYRAKLDPDGNLLLYMERFEGEGGESIPLWYSPLGDNGTMSTTERRVLRFLVTIFLPSVAAFFYVVWPKDDRDFKQRRKDAAAATCPKKCS